MSTRIKEPSYLVPNDLLRDKVDRARMEQGMAWTEVAELCGWVSKGRGDSTRVKRLLGMVPLSDGTEREELDSEDAAKIVRAVGLDPVDVGL